MHLSKRLLYPLGLVASLALVVGVTRVIAAPPGSVYTPGETLAPSCAPGSENCTVTAPMAAVTPGTSGNVLTSNGTSWASVAPAGGGVSFGTRTVTVSAADLQALGSCTNCDVNIGSALPSGAKLISAQVSGAGIQNDANPGITWISFYVDGVLFGGAPNGGSKSVYIAPGFSSPENIANESAFWVGRDVSGDQAVARFTCSGGQGTNFTTGSVTVDLLYLVE